MPETDAPALSACEKHLFGPGPKRILALDGGGTKGIIELAFLARIEAVLRHHHGDDPAFRLADWFDLIGGTSTGSIIAAGLAMGIPVAELTRLYLELAPQAFRQRSWRIAGLVSLFDAKPLQMFLHSLFGERAMDSTDLRTGLAVIAQRFDTGSPWLISNNTRAPYWQDPEDCSYLGNRHYRLTEVIRASTAAPGYFQPQKITVIPGGKPALFVDGGLSPHNNPAIMLLMMTQAKTFRLEWAMGPAQLMLISIGAGQYRRRPAPAHRSPFTAGGLAAQGLMQALSTGQMQTLTLLQWMSEPALAWPMNSEIGDLAGELLGGRALFGFQRYDMLLEAPWLQAQLGLLIPEKYLDKLRRFDEPEVMKDLYEMATTVATQQVKVDHLISREGGE